MSSVLNSRRIMDYNPELTINQQAYSSYCWLYAGPVFFPIHSPIFHPQKKACWVPKR